ncbi:MAG: DUF1829 domain-containing protein [Pirellulales bacterium]|nr:DUF1829 domain-containing protein [Pirellulales bacterium]
MIYEVQKLLDDYWKWLKDKTTLRELQEWIEITTPYLDRHNDFIQIYAKKQESGYLLTDDGYVLSDLEQSGCRLDSRKRQELLKMTINGFGVRLEGTELQIHASQDNFPLRKHSLVQAILAVNDMFYLAMPMVASLFHEDVVEWLDSKDIRYTPHPTFRGKSGYDHVFDFVIPKSRKQPERIIKAINRPNRDTAQSFAFSWIDIKEVRPADAKAYAILNDTEHAVSETVIDALHNYGVTPIKWTMREESLQDLAA